MHEPSSARAMLFVAAVFIFNWPSPSAIAQQMADRQQGAAPASPAAPSIITTEGELKATVFTYRDGNLVTRYKYF